MIPSFGKTLGRHGAGPLLVGALVLSASAPRAAPPSRGPRSSQELALSAKELLKEQRLTEAERLLRQCLAADPNAARCHLLLGSTLAKKGKVDEAAPHYRDFLRLAPEDPSADTVKRILEAYDTSRAHK